MRIRKFATALAVVACMGSARAGIVLSEGFDNIATLAGSGWVLTNNSAPPGGNWFQGNSGVFASQAGAPNSYIADNFLATSQFDGVVDAWLISPVLSLPLGGALTFATRTDSSDFADLLEVRFSLGAGSSTASFTTLLTVVGDASQPYPYGGWQAYTVALPNANNGRFAFRYFVADASNANYIGIDSVNVTAAVPEPSVYLLLGAGTALIAWRRRRVSAPV